MDQAAIVTLEVSLGILLGIYVGWAITSGWYEKEILIRGIIWKK